MSSSCDFIAIQDDCPLYDADLLPISKAHRPFLDKVLIPNGILMDRTNKVARDIVDYYYSKKVKEFHLVCILNGSFYFFCELVKAAHEYIIHKNYEMEVLVQYVRLKSYVDDQSTGEVRILGRDCSAFVTGNNIMIVEDIIDTGKTMNKLLEHIGSLNPASVAVTSLLLKRTPLSSGYRPDFLGFEIPDFFVIGWGLDYNEHFRTLSHVCIINENGKKTLSQSQNQNEA